MNSDELRNYATVLAAVIALLVFIANSLASRRNRRIENLSRFIDAHDRLFDRGGYLYMHIVDIEAGTLVRDTSNSVLEKKFHIMLLEIEHLALLANNHAVPRLTQVYMFGTYAQNLLNLMTPQERKSMLWELAVTYLERLARDTEKYRSLAPAERRRFWR
jgi:hypothetical protein